MPDYNFESNGEYVWQLRYSTVEMSSVFYLLKKTTCVRYFVKIISKNKE